MNLKDFVLENQKVINLVKDRVGGDSQVDMYYGTLDYATARFHTILLKLSQDAIREQQFYFEVGECFKTIQDFYKNVYALYGFLRSFGFYLLFCVWIFVPL